MAETWLFDTLLSLDEVVRVERGPQIVELTCNTTNLSNLVTHPQYCVGKRDALGRIIGTEVKMGEMMAVVDYRALHVPHLWKVYRWQREILSQIPLETRMSWKKIDQFENFDDALTLARQLRREMTSDAVHC